MITTTDAANAQQLIRCRWLGCLIFMTYAVTSDAVGLVIPRVIAEFGISLTAASALAYIPSAAVGLAAILFGASADRFGRQRMIVLGLSLSGVGLLLFSVTNSFHAFVALLALVGLGIGISRISALAMMGDISTSARDHTAHMNLIEGCFAVGSLIGPAVLAVLLTQGMSWKWLYVLASGLCAAWTLLALRIRFRILPRHHDRPAALLHTMALLRDRHALWFAMLIMLCVIIESAVVVWMPTFLSGPGSSLRFGAYALTTYLVLRAVGRFAGTRLLRHYSARAALAVCGLLLLLCFIGTVSGAQSAGAWLLPLSGLFVAIMYPTINSMCISCFRADEQGTAAGIMLFFTAIASIVGPLSFAAVSDATGDLWHGYLCVTVITTAFAAALVWNWLGGPAHQRLLLMRATQ